MSEHEPTFGERLQAWRTEQSIGRRAIQQKTGMSLGYLHEIENDRYLPSEAHVRAIADALGQPAEAMVFERNKAFFAEKGLDPEAAARLYELGELSASERQRLTQLLAELAALRHMPDL